MKIFKYLIGGLACLCFIFIAIYAYYEKTSSTQKCQPIASITVCVQPFSDMSPSDVNRVVVQLRHVFSDVRVNAPIPFPKNSWNYNKTRHRGDILIQYLSKQTKKGERTIGLTSKDISVTSGNHPDWGVMGYGYCPGKSCIASSFRLKGKNKLEKLYKVAIHELGHNQGLPHCANKTCLMRDAEGKDHINEEKDFCSKCKTIMKMVGWIH